jgi:His/Glu/Gln/Arg/opine family amino acid ABC transporter permease subunit
MLATYDWSLIWEHRVDFLNGLKVALEVSFVAMVLSIVVGIFLALARMSRPPLSWFASAYINVFRGVPALVSVIWVYFGWSLLLGISFSVFQAGVLAPRSLYGAFIAEIYRSALEAIPRPAEAARARHEPARVFGRIILPQATKIAIPNIGSMFIGMVKDTSVFTVIGLLGGRARDTEHQLDHVPAVRAVHRRRRPVRHRRVRHRLRLPGDREVAHHTAEGPHRAYRPRTAAPPRRAGRPGLPGRVRKGMIDRRP